MEPGVLEERYIEHQFDPQSFGDQDFEQVVKKLLLQKLIDQERKNPHDSTYMVSSKGKKMNSPYIYVGTSGNTYLYYRLYTYAKRTNQGDMADMYLIKALESYQISKDYLAQKATKGEIRKDDMSPSFFMGNPGIFTLAAILSAESEGPDSKEVKECLEEVLLFIKLFDDHAEDLEEELLYGSAGYLYCLLLLKKKFGAKFNEQLDPAIAKVVDSLLVNGTKKDVDFLYYTFPRGNTAFLGAAHGAIGIIYMLIKAMQALPLLQYNSYLVQKIKNTLKMIIEQQSPTGNFPYKYNSPVKELLEATHWCHGAPGAIPLFLEAYNFFKDKIYLDIALKCGECTWTRGVLKKSLALCHGICGNAYLLMSLYKATGDFQWKQRAERFLLLTGDETVRNTIKAYKKGGLEISGIPDTPYSLMEGQAGHIVAYADFLGWKDCKHNELDIMFPGHEL